MTIDWESPQWQALMGASSCIVAEVSQVHLISTAMTIPHKRIRSAELVAEHSYSDITNDGEWEEEHPAYYALLRMEDGSWLLGQAYVGDSEHPEFPHEWGLGFWGWAPKGDLKPLLMSIIDEDDEYASRCHYYALVKAMPLNCRKAEGFW